MEEYFVSKAGKTEGPLPENEINRRLQVGELAWTDLVCQKGWSKWEPAEKVFQRPAIPVTLVPSDYIQPTREKRGSGAVIGGWVCFALAIVLAFIPFPTFYAYLPLLLVAFILGIVAIAQKRIANGISLILCAVIGTPLTIALGLFMAGLTLAGISKGWVEAQQEARYLSDLVSVGETNPTIKAETDLAIKRDPEGEYKLGMRYLTGDGLPTNVVQANAWLEKAAAQNHEGAKTELRKLKAGSGK